MAKTIEFVKPLLLLITATIKPGEGQRHNLTINEDGEVELTLMLGDKFLPVIIPDDSLSKGYIELAEDIEKLVLDREKV